VKWRKKGNEKKAGKTRKGKTTKTPKIKEFVGRKRDNNDKQKKRNILMHIRL